MVGLLLDSLSQNTGDQAILEVMLGFLKREQRAFDLLSPLGFDARPYQPIIIGGGHILRDRGDWFYDAFRVRGHHILNVAGVSTTDGLGYLAEYAYVSVRSHQDWIRVVPAAPQAVVCPCVSLKLQPDNTSELTPEGSIGFHFHEQSWAACGDEKLFLDYQEYPQALLPVTHYNGDYWLLRNLSARIPVRHTLLPRLPPRAVLNEIGRMRALVCSSLHAAIFSYSRNVPFLAFGYPEKIAEFMEDRGLQEWIFRDRSELRSKLALLLDKPPDYSASLARDLKRLDEHFKCLIDCLPQGSNVVGRNGIELPSVEHKLIVEHHNRLAVLERVADRLLTASERIERDASRQDSRVDHLKRLIEEGGEAAAPSGVNSQAPSNLPFGSVESPGPGEVICDECQVSGWALAATGISEIDIYVDSGFVGAATYGDPRPDVARAYPGLPDVHYPGWKITLDARQLTKGAHELLIQARSRGGLTRDLASFPVTVGSQEDRARFAASKGAPAAASSPPSPPADVKLELENALQGIAGQFQELHRSLDDGQARVDAALGTIRSEFEGLKNTLESNGARVGANESGISALTTQVASLSANIDALREVSSSLEERAGKSEASVTQALSKNQSEIRNVAAGLARLDHRVHVNTLQIRSIFQSRIWKTLRMLASPLYLLTGSSRGQRETQTNSLKPPSDDAETSSPDGPFVPEASTSPDPEAPIEMSREAEDALLIGIDSQIPSTIIVGKGNAICVMGWCYHPRQRISRLEIIADEVRHPVKAYGNVRGDVFSAHYPHLDPQGHSFRSGFWGVVAFPGRSADKVAHLFLYAVLEDGQECLSRIGSTTLSVASSAKRLALPEASPHRGLVVICLTTYNPPLDLFSRQIESLIQQSYQNWICIISDDCSPLETYREISSLAGRDLRFHVYQTPERLGFYQNFEFCLSLVPADADFVTLCDHDDYWHPDKLESLMSAFGADTTLAYSDMRIVDNQGQVLFNTYWTTRKNNYKNLTSLLIANTITGAASMFRRSLLELALPFPRTPGEPYHDHWIACVALATGEISYVDRPLYDYVQHTGNVIGHYVASKGSWLRNVWTVLTDRVALDRTLALWRDIYFGDVLRIELLTSVIQLRATQPLASGKRRALRRLSKMDDSLATGLWLTFRRIRELWRGNETLAAETRLLRGILWKYCSALRGRFGSAPQMPGSVKNEPRTVAPVQTAATAAPEVHDAVAFIRQKIAPLRLAVSHNSNWRVNLLIPTIDFDYIFGGYIAKFNLAQKLADRGFRVRLVIVDYCDYKPELWKQQVRQYDGMSRVLDCCELTWAFDRHLPLAVTPNDCFIATTWWTAHIAQEAGRELGKRAFLYLIQEYEPFTFPMGTFASLARETYNWPHYALFSTEFLRDFFRQEHLGVFGSSDGEKRSAVFQNAITKVDPLTIQEMRGRNKRKLLFYARPEAHAARNMFELGMLALCTAIEADIFDDRWEFTGIGSVATSSRVNLVRGRHMQLLRRQDQAGYKNVLREHDLGLSLMYTPHPSLVPIEMASSGMVVVTNTFANKTDERLRSISPNFIGVEPTVKDIVIGLKAAVSKVEQFEQRIVGAKVNWCSDWNEAFGDSVMERVEGFLEDISQEREDSIAQIPSARAT